MGIAKKCLKFVYKDGKTTIKRNNIEIANDIEPDEISDYIDELQKDSKKKGKSWDQYLDEIAENKSKTKPSKIKDPLAKPRGNITKIPYNTNMANKVSLELENEAAEILAKEGYDIEQNPIVNGTLKNPDYKIEGEIFDCYSPFEKNKSVRGIWFEVENKVLKGQTKRVVLNLKNWEGDITKLQKQFSDWEIENLQEVMYITKNAKINHIKITK